ncbi:hypothetical protein U753_03860 [Streptococcus pseudopneumoniae 5247]|nr:hypothetical protein U753_03860 [Streptococcus pseudopneumoniae 5247]
MSFLFCTIDRLLTKFTVNEFLNRKTQKLAGKFRKKASMIKFFVL